MHTQPRRQRGAILVLTILFLMILLAVAALVIDVGRLYVLRTQMQNAADSAALAAAYELNGKDGARQRAVKAATQMLSHEGPFSTSDDKDLLTHLQSYYDPANPENSAFVFYSWIGSELDPDPADIPCTPTNGKCLATSDDDAHYVRVVLDPLLTAEVGDYGVDFYFAPSMALFFAGDPITQGTTTVSALAGAGGPIFCKYPPLFMCAYDEGAGYPGIGVGEEIALRVPAANTAWGPGNIGYLDVEEDIEIELDDGSKTRLEKNKDAMAAALGNEFIRKECDEAIVSTLTGVDQQKTRKAFNTRFGLYQGNDGFDNAKGEFPPAPNAIDYPRDDTFVERKGNGWNITECLTPSGCGGESRPETFNRDHYILYNHQNGDPNNTNPVPSLGTESMPDGSRYSLYQWELSDGGILHRPQLGNVPDLALDQRDCDEVIQGGQEPGSKYCWLHSGEPIDGDPDLGTAERRILRVAVIKCTQYNIQGNTPDINLNPQGEFPFHKFFLTQHAQDPSNAEFLAEYIGPVSRQQEIQEIRHTVIQLYE